MSTTYLVRPSDLSRDAAEVLAVLTAADLPYGDALLDPIDPYNALSEETP